MTTETSFGSTSLTSLHSSASSPVFSIQLMMKSSSSSPSPTSLSSSSSPSSSSSSGAATSSSSSSSSFVPLSPPSFTTLLPVASVLASSPISPVTSQLMFLSTSSSSSAAAAAPATSPSLLSSSSSSSSLSPTSLSSPSSSSSSSTSEIKKKLQLRVMAKRSQEAILNSSASSSSSFSLSSSSSSSSSASSSSAFPLLSSSSSSAFLRGTGQQKSPSSENHPFATTTTTTTVISLNDKITSSTKQQDNSSEATKTTVISQALLTQIQLYLQLKKLLQQKQQQHQLSQHFQQLLQLQQDLQTANSGPSQKQQVVNSIRPVVMTTKPVVKPGPGNGNFGDNKITVGTGYPLSANSSAQVCNLLLAEKLRNLEQEILEKKKLLLSVRPQAINFMTLPTTSSTSVSTIGQLPSTEPLAATNAASLAGQNAALNSTQIASNSVNTASKNFLFGATTPSKPADCQSTSGEVVSFYSHFPSGTFNNNNNSSSNNNNNNGNMECDDFMSTDVSDTQVNTVSSELSFDLNSDSCDILSKESTKKRRKSSTSENSSSLPKKQKSVKTTGAMIFKSCATPQSTNSSAPTTIQAVASCSIATNSCSSSKTPEGTNTLENLKVFELKVECRKRHLSVSGNKQSLLLRLLPFSDAILQQQQLQQSQVSGQTTDSEASLSCGSSSDGLGASQSVGELNVGRQVLSGLEPKISDVPSFGNALVKSTVTRKSVVPLANKIVSSAPNSLNVSTLDAIVRLSSTFDANNYFNNKAIKSTGDHSQVKILGDLAAASTQSVENTTANLEIEKILSSRQICQLLWEKQQRELLKVHLELMDMERRLTTARGHVFNKTSQQSSKTNVLNGNKIVIGNQPEQQNLAVKLIRDSIQKSLKQASNPGQLLNITTLLNSLSANQQPKLPSFGNNDPFQGTDQILTGNNSCLLSTSEEIPGFDLKGSLFSDGLPSQKNKDSILIDDSMNGDHDTDEQNFQGFDSFNCCDEEEDEDGEREMDDVSEGFCAEDLETDDQHPPPPQYHEAVLLKKIQALAEMARNSGQLPPYTPPEQSTPVFLPNFQSPTNHVPFPTYMDDDIYMLALNEPSNKAQVSIADKCLGSNLTDATVLMSGANSVNGVLAGSNPSSQERAFCSALQPINPIFNNLGISETTNVLKNSSQTLQSTVDCFFSPPMPNLGDSTPDGGQCKTSCYNQNQDEDELWFQDQWFDSWGVNEESLTGVENKEPAPLLSPKSSSSSHSSSSSSSSSLFFDAFVDGQDLFNRPLTNLVKH